MKIAVHAGGHGGGLDAPGRGETRWGLHWNHILRKNGYESENVSGHYMRSDHDLHLLCGLNQNECDPEVKHIHMYCGIPSKETIAPFPCYQNNNCVIASMYYDYYERLRDMGEEVGYLGVPMSIPFSDDMIDKDLTDVPFDRTEITWAAKEIWCPELGARCERVPRIGMYFLKAIEALDKKADFTFNLVQPSERGCQIKKAPQQAQEIFSRISSVREVKAPRFSGILDVMSSSKLSLGVAGAVASTVDALFCRALPLAHSSMGLAYCVAGTDMCLPDPGVTTEDQVVELMERFWLDRDFYNQAWDRYQDRFFGHREPQAIKAFEKILEQMEVLQ